MPVNPLRKHLVLLGAGRAHLQFMKSLARQPGSDFRVTLVATHPHYIEAGMLPGYVGGQYVIDDIRVELGALLDASGAALAEAQIQTLDPVTRRVLLSSGDALAYDVLSVDTEPVIDRDRAEALIPGARANALFTHPVDAFVQLWPQMLPLARERMLQVAVLADDLPGAELAMAAAHALGAPHGSRVTLVAGDLPLLGQQPLAVQRRVLARLRARHITVLQEHCAAIEPGALQLASGATLRCDAPIVTIGARTPPWLLESGLEVTESGDIQTNERLQSDSHRQVFVVPSGAPPEAASTLEANLRAALGKGSFRKAPLKAPGLRVINCGDGRAVALWGPLSFEGREVWHWKDRRDRRQLAALRSP